ncbi:MAG: glycosyltransferase family 4 protein [Bacteroidota bacterium]
MKILFVLEHFYPYLGGAEQLFTELAKTLVRKGHSVTVVTTLYDPTLAKEEILEGVQIIRLNCFNRFGFTFLSLPRVLQIARQSDLIHTTTYNAALPAWLASRLLKKPVIITFHEVWGKLWMQLPFLPLWQRKIYQLFEGGILKLSFHRYIAVSRYTQKCLAQAGIPAKRIKAIYNGLDYATFAPHQPTPPKVFTYTYFGRLGISKGLDLLLPAAQGFYQKFPNSKLQLIIPQYPKAIFQAIKKRIHELKLDQHIRLLHDLPRQELYEKLCQSSCVVIPSYSEGFCFAAAEVVALGIPIISSQKGALKEVVSGRYLPIEPFETQALFVSLSQAIKGEWKEIPVRIFPLEKTVEQHVNLYSEILEQKPSP